MDWKERLMFHKKHALEKRGIVLSDDPVENKRRRDEVGVRGGIVFVSKQAEKEFNGDVSGPNS